MVSVKFWKRVRSVQLDPRAVQAQEIKQAEVEAAVTLRRLTEERKLMEARLHERREELLVVQEPEARRLAKIIYLWWLVPLLVAMVCLAIWSNLWGLEAFTGLDPRKRWMVALCFPGLALVGGIALGIALRMEPGMPLRKVYFSVGFTVLVLAILGTMTINVVRGLDTLRLEDRQRGSLALETELDASATRGEDTAVDSDKRLLGALFTVASVVMGVAGELGSAYACDQLLLLLIPVWTVARLRRRITNLEAALVENAVAEERARHQPDLTRALVAMEVIEAEEIIRRPESEPPSPKPEDESLKPLAWRILFTILAIALVLFCVMASRAHSAERLATHTVILLDLSSSAAAQEEFTKNLNAVDGLIARIRESGGQRVAIFGITEASFSNPPLLVSTGPREAGRYGEYLDRWQRSVLADWHGVRAQLSPSAKGSDIFGALARAAVEFDESDARTKRLIIFSDMRQVGRGFDLERIIVNHCALVELAHRQGLIPRLEGIEVSVLGAHTAGVDERQWTRLRALWIEYFKRAKANLNLFTPTRRLPIFDPQPTSRPG